MHLGPQGEEALEAHDERTPAVGVDAIPVPGQPDRFGHVHSRNADLDRDECAAGRRGCCERGLVAGTGSGVVRG